jgi:hypothetical protein
MDITDKKTRRSGSLSRVRLVFEHGRDRFFVADTTNRFGQHTDRVRVRTFGSDLISSLSGMVSQTTTSSITELRRLFAALLKGR